MKLAQPPAMLTVSLHPARDPTWLLPTWADVGPPLGRRRAPPHSPPADGGKRVHEGARVSGGHCSSILPTTDLHPYCQQASGPVGEDRRTLRSAPERFCTRPTASLCHAVPSPTLEVLGSDTGALRLLQLPEPQGSPGHGCSTPKHPNSKVMEPECLSQWNRGIIWERSGHSLLCWT